MASVLCDASPERVQTFLDWVCSDIPSSSSSAKRQAPIDSRLSPEVPVKRAKTTQPQVFVTNIPFSATQQSLRAFFEKLQVPADRLFLGQDALGKFQGWCIVSLVPGSSIASSVTQIDGKMFLDRQLYAAETEKKIVFRLPEELIDRLRQIRDERNLSGTPACRLADGYRRVFGEKFPAERFGFRTFLHALQSIPGVSVFKDERNSQSICVWK